ncbi:MAG: hypothetical protein JNK33_05285, partial [Candidatus Doudnabacteria bacterium]|nr:hypothetical protein [Candidatus Doudnabacteria bacterium]
MKRVLHASHNHKQKHTGGNVMLSALGLVVFILGYAAIAAEHKIKVSKTATALLTGVTLWLLAATSKDVTQDLTHSGSEIFDIVMFLLAAMSLVEILV